MSFLKRNRKSSKDRSSSLLRRSLRSDNPEREDHDGTRPTTQLGSDVSLAYTSTVTSLNSMQGTPVAATSVNTLPILSNGPTSSEAQSPQEKASLWDLAYDSLKADDNARTGKLIKEYEELLQQALLSESTPSKIDNANISGETDFHPSHGIFDRTSRRLQLEEQLKRAKAKHEARGKIIIRGHIIDIKDCIVKIAGGVETVQNLVGQAVKASPEASVAWSVVCLSLDLFTKSVQVEEINSDGLAYVSSRMVLYMALEQLLLPDDAPVASRAAQEEIRLRLIELYKNILDFQIRSIVRFRKGHWYKDIYGKDDWQAMRDHIQTLESDIRNDSSLISVRESNVQSQLLLKGAKEAQDEMSRISGQQLKYLQEIEANLVKQTDFQSQKLQLAQRLEADRQEEKENKCMEALRLDQRYDDSKNRIPSRVEGTCYWFLNQVDYKNWLASSKGCLLVSADPGCGKSVLAKHIIEHELPYKDAKRIVCYFFFKDQIQNTFAMALSAILHQLLQKVPTMFKHLLPLYKSDGVTLIRNSTGLSEVLSNILSDPQMWSVTIVLDALDECEGNDMERLLIWIARFNDSKNSVSRHKFLLTSRPYQETITRFKRMKGSLYVHIPGNDKSKEISEEVNLVIKYRCQKLYEDGRIYENARDALLSKLLAQPHNTYLFVYLVFDELEGPSQYNQTKRELEKRLRDLPHSVNQAYERILNKYTKENKAIRKTVVRVLSVMLSARRPLKIEEVQCAVKLDLQDLPMLHEELDLEDAIDFRNKLRDWCGLFVQIDHEDQVTFLHQTAREFLLPKVGKDSEIYASTTWAHSITLVEAHELLARISMVYLSLKNFSENPETFYYREDQYSNVEGLNNQRSARIARLKERSKQYPFLSYAAVEWNYHFVQGQCDKSPASLDKALALYDGKTNNFLIWAMTANAFSKEEILGLLGNLRWGIPLVMAVSLCQPIFIRLASTTNLLDLPYCKSAFMLAIERRNEENAITFLDQGIDPNCQDNGRTALYECVERSLKSVTTSLLRYGVRIDTDTLCRASRQHDTYFLSAFLNHGVDVNVLTSLGYTPLLHATSSNSTKAATLLLEHKAETNLRSPKENYSALYLAAVHGNIDIVRKLLDYDADINAQTDHGDTALLCAAYEGHSHVVQLLLERHAEVDVTDKDGSTALACAATRGFQEIVELLLEYHADTGKSDKQGYSALHKAAQYGHINVMKTLLHHGTVVDAQTKHGSTALLLSAQYGHISIVEMLLSYEADGNIMDADGDTPIMCAAMNGHHNIVQIFLQHKATVVPSEIGGNTALHLAAEGDIYGKDTFAEDEDVVSEAEHCMKTMQLLLEASIDVNTVNHEGKTPIMRAVSRLRSHRPILQFLLDRGADINVRDKNGRTCMHYINSKETFEMLLENGLNINEKDSSGQTPLLYIMLQSEPTEKLSGIYHAMVSHGADLTIADNQGLSPPKSFDGRFSVYSQDILLDDRGNLFAKYYKRIEYYLTNSKIDLNACLKVENGGLIWAHNGSFSASARNTKLVYEGRILQTEALDDNGAWKQAFIWLDERIAMEDQKLKFLGPP